MKKIEEYSNWLKDYKYQRQDVRVEKALIKCQASKILERDSYETQQHLQKNMSNENNDLSEHLMCLKSSYNEAFKEIAQKQSQVIRIKNETDAKIQKIKTISSERQSLLTSITKLQEKLQSVKMKKQSAFFVSKNYEHILQRMRKDSIIFQLRRNQLEVQLKLCQTIHHQKQNKYQQYKQMQSLSVFGLKQVKDQHKLQNSYRISKINKINTIVTQQKEKERKKEERKFQTKLIQQMAADDLQDAQLLRIKRFLKVQLFLQLLLRAKISRIKTFFQPYQQAFFKIKSLINAKDASEMKNYFFNFSKRFQEKTFLVKKLEQDIERIQCQNKKLKLKYKQLKDSELQIVQQIEQKVYLEQKENSGDIAKKSFECELKMIKIKEWLYQIGKQFDINTKRSLENVFNDMCVNLKKLKRIDQK